MTGVQYHDKGALLPVYVAISAIGGDTKKMSHLSNNALQIRPGEKKAAQEGVAELRRLLSHHQHPSGEQESTRDDVAGEIRKFAELRAEGILTDAEFEAKKAELLGRI